MSHVMECAPIARDLVYSNVSYATLGVAEGEMYGETSTSYQNAPQNTLFGPLLHENACVFF